MTAITVAVVWLVVGLVVAVLFGTAIRRAHREQDDETLPAQNGAQVRYLRKRNRRNGTAVSIRKHTVKRHIAV